MAREGKCLCILQRRGISQRWASLSLLPALSHNGLSVVLQHWTLQCRSRSLWLSKMMDREISVVWQVSFKTPIYLVRYGENIPLPFTL